MQAFYKQEMKFTDSDKVYHFDENGKCNLTKQYMAKRCPQCNRFETIYKIEDIAIICCANQTCLDQRFDNAIGCADKYPLNYLKFLKKRNTFANIILEKEGRASDFYEKWQLLKQGKIKDIILNGEIGVGKTACLYAALREVCKNNSSYKAMFMTENELYEHIKHSWDSGQMLSEKEIVQKISEVDFLFLDDLGSAVKTNQGDWGKQMLLDILDERLNSYTLRTIVSTNFSLDQIAQIYDTRIADRLKLMRQAIISGESRRTPIERVEIPDTESLQPIL